MSCGIYRFQNIITLQSYIGQSINLEDRYKRHHRDWINGTTDFYKAVQDWGWENFSYEVIEECLPERLNEREIYWITYYDSYNNGYNQTRGGSTLSPNIDKQICDLYTKGMLPSEIAKNMQISLTTVYKYLSCFQPFVDDKEQQTIPVYQFDLTGKMIKKWASASAASKALNIDKNSIYKVISGKRNSAGNFLWSKEEKINTNVKVWKHIQVHQYDKNLNFIQTFDTIAEAAKSVGGDSSLIKRVCNKGTKYSAYGYKWSFNKF